MVRITKNLQGKTVLEMTDKNITYERDEINFSTGKQLVVKTAVKELTEEDIEELIYYVDKYKSERSDSDDKV